MNNYFPTDEEIDEFLEKWNKEQEEWEAKYTWNNDEPRFKENLDLIINKMTARRNSSAYNIASDETYEPEKDNDWNYLMSLQIYLCDLLNEKGEEADFEAPDEYNMFATMEIPFKYKNQIYVLEEGHGQGSYFDLYIPTYEIGEEDIVEVD